MITPDSQLKTFRKTIWDFYRKNKRPFPWRETTSPYAIFISEVMLQQTQTNRVIPKYNQFLKSLPDFAQLAKASFPEVLLLWSGLGYNRRALYLQKAAQIIMNDYQGILPREPELLEKLPGIGKATARSISTFAFNLPHAFIETNIRRVYIHFFFSDQESVDDGEILKLVTQTVDPQKPRDWYYALMDYGAMLKGLKTNPNKKSKHYTLQSKFEGSVRKVRGEILRQLLMHKTLSEKQLQKLMAEDDKKMSAALKGLLKDKLIEQYKSQIRIVIA